MAKSEIAFLHRVPADGPIPPSAMIVKPGRAHVIVNTSHNGAKHLDVYSMPEWEWREMLKFWQELNRPINLTPTLSILPDWPEKE